MSGRRLARAGSAEKALSLIDWQPSGRGTGQDLIAAVTNSWQVAKDIGEVPANSVVKAEDAVDARFLP